MSGKVHVSDKGVGVCKAKTPWSCPFGFSNHYDSFKDAEDAFAWRMGGSFGGSQNSDYEAVLSDVKTFSPTPQGEAKEAEENFVNRFMEILENPEVKSNKTFEVADDGEVIVVEKQYRDGWGEYGRCYHELSEMCLDGRIKRDYPEFYDKAFYKFRGKEGVTNSCRITRQL